jgi:hypothetical protein
MATTAPGMVFLSISRCMAMAICASCREDTPTDSGLAKGSGWASAPAQMTSKNVKASGRLRSMLLYLCWRAGLCPVDFSEKV